MSSRWPGSVSDQRVFRNSNLFQRLESGWRPVDGGILLGDSGYANTNYLITPILVPQTDQELAFNRAHRKTRHIIECAIGLLKQRFRCLLKPQHLAPAFVADIIRCCAALHNLLLAPDEAAVALEEGNRWRPDPNLEDEDTDDDDEGSDEGNVGRRNEIVARF